MHWLPDDTNFLTVLSSILTVATAALGLLVTFNQLTKPASARRTIDWTTAALATETDEMRRSALEELKLNSQGYLIATARVPWWRFLGVIAIILTAVSLTGITVCLRVPVAQILFAAVPGAFWIGLIGSSALLSYVERLRVADAFVAGRQYIGSDSGDGRHHAFWLSLLCGVGFVSAAAGVALQLSGITDSVLWEVLGLVVPAATSAWACLSVSTFVKRWSSNMSVPNLTAEASEPTPPSRASDR